MVVCACFCQKCKLCLILAGILVIFVIAGVALREFIVKINVKFEGLLSLFWRFTTRGVIIFTKNSF